MTEVLWDGYHKILPSSSGGYRFFNFRPDVGVTSLTLYSGAGESVMDEIYELAAYS